jgi:arginase family enzyme
MRDVTPRIREVVESGTMPIFLGGDHTLPAFTLPEIERFHKAKTGIIWIDQHYDQFWGKDLMPTAGSALCHFFQNAQSSPTNLAIIGIGGSQNTTEMGRDLAPDRLHRLYDRRCRAARHARGRRARHGGRRQGYGQRLCLVRC